MKITASRKPSLIAQRFRLLAAPVLLLWAGHSLAASMTLVEAMDRAWQNDPSVPGSQARSASEREAGIQERSTRLPSVAADATYTYGYSDSKFAFGESRDSYPSWSAGLEARQALFRLDWSARGDRADAQDALADALYERRRIGLFARVAERFFGVLVAEDNYQQAQAEAEAVRESLENTRKRYEVDLVPGTDLKEAQARDDLARAQVLSTEQELESARDVLAETLGSRDFDLPKLPKSVALSPITPSDVESWIATAEQTNPDLVIARHQAQIARTQVRSRRAEATPQLDLVARAGRTDSTEYVLGQRQDDASIGVELNLPIYAGGLNQSRVREAEALAVAAEQDAKLTASETERRVRRNFRLLQTDYIQVGAYERVLESATLAQAAVKAGYDAGTRTITDVLDAQSRVVQARRDLNQTRYNLLLHLLQLRQSVGQMTVAHLAAVDTLFTQNPEQP